MTRTVVALWLSIIWCTGVWCAAQEPAAEHLASSAPSNIISPTSSSKKLGPLFFPQNFARGYVDFEMAPPHNEIDLGLCVVTTADPKSSAASCNAFARYAWSGYLELRPFGRTPLRRTFVFVE